VECETGWGTRPDGYTLHKTMEDRKAYVDEYWAKMPDKMPAEFSSPDGNPQTVTVDEQNYQEVIGSRNGVWRPGMWRQS
jgi:hypothetical protein